MWAKKIHVKELGKFRGKSCKSNSYVILSPRKLLGHAKTQVL
jgi:hypothetical protein